MRKFLTLLAASLGGWIGWWLGDKANLLTAFLLSMVGTGVGIYYGNRFSRMYGD